MKINEIEVKKFRNLENIKIAFKSRLNAIAGQNGTSKTSILGLIGHIFTFDSKVKTLAGKNFFTDFSEIFRFAYPDYDKAGDHIWITRFDSTKVVPAISYDRKGYGETQTIRVRVGKSKLGSGKLKLPVIYLGMGRLFPLALEKDIKNTTSELTAAEAKEFTDLHNEILLITDENIEPESVVAGSKSFHAPKSDKYNHLGNSAGQDNIGQIITALVSFKRLQKLRGEEYKGGILLIDELDASLFPAAQMKLVELLYKKSQQLNLQIFFTTHSLDVLVETRKHPESNVIFLDKSAGKINPKYDLDINSLKNDLLVLGPAALERINSQKDIYCEDEEAADMLKAILPKETRQKIRIYPMALGGDEIKNLARKQIPVLKNGIFVLDGDYSSGTIKNVISLPGNAGPDRLIYNMLKSMDASEFVKIKSGYTKQFCFKDLVVLDSSSDTRAERIKLKAWYKAQSEYWGAAAGRIWKIWCAQNTTAVKDFEAKFNLLIE